MSKLSESDRDEVRGLSNAELNEAVSTTLQLIRLQSEAIQKYQADRDWTGELLHELSTEQERRHA